VPGVVFQTFWLLLPDHQSFVIERILNYGDILATR